MIIHDLPRRPLDMKQYVKRSALPTDAARLITEDTLITCEGRPVLLYKVVGPEMPTTEIRAAVRRLKYNKSTRTTGLVSESAIFGYDPRNTLRKDYCSAAGMAFNQPAEHAAVTAFGPCLAHLYAEYFPQVYAAHLAQATEKILPDWRINETPFTSGIVNRNNPLKYHFDSGNFEGVLSNMVVFKAGISGGRLVCPEFDIILDCADHSVVLFDGQKILHGVTPITHEQPGAYRYSVVYYTLRQMWNCQPVSEEIARIRKVHTLRERNRKNITIGQMQADKPRT